MGITKRIWPDAPVDHSDIVCPQDVKNIRRIDVLQGCYDAKWKIAREFQPTTICEIGVCCGYSAHAWVEGSPKAESYLGIDCDDRAHYGGPWLWWAERLLGLLATKYGITWEILARNSQTLSQIPQDMQFDLIHVDGDHTHGGCMYDMRLSWPAVKPGGIMVVDDATYLPGPRGACAEFTRITEDAARVYLEPSPAGSMVYVKEGG